MAVNLKRPSKKQRQAALREFLGDTPDTAFDLPDDIGSEGPAPCSLPTKCPLPKTPAELLTRCAFCWARPATLRLRSLVGMHVGACGACYSKNAKAWPLRPADDCSDDDAKKEIESV